MVFHKLFSQRKKDSEKEGPDVYQYDKIAEPIKAQIEFIWDDAIGYYFVPAGYGTHVPNNNNEGWNLIRKEVCKSKGQRTLKNQSNPKEDCLHYLFQETEIDKWLDLIEFSFSYIFQSVPKIRNLAGQSITQKPENAIDDLNECFLNSGMGYQFESGQIIRIDNQMVHAEIVKPALAFLSDPRFSGPQDEFLSAHAHFRLGENKDAIVDASNSFESTMKAICDIKGWNYNKGNRASDLIKVLRAKGFFPAYLDKSFDQLVATLSSGLPQVRNKEGSHGQGAKTKNTPQYIAAYSLHLAAAKILFLVGALKESEK